MWFSLAAENKGYSLVVVASHYSGFSCGETPALGAQASGVVKRGSAVMVCRP